MTDWKWRLERDHEGTFWKTVSPGLKWARFYISDGTEFDSAYYGHSIISATTEFSPIQARLYRLVYGSLP